MNDIRRTILWVIFGFSMVLLWDKWQMHNGKQATFFPTPASTAASAPAAAPVQAGNAAVPSASAPAALAQGAAAVPGQPAAALQTPRERIEVTTDIYRLGFDTEGGSLTEALPRQRWHI